VSAFAELLGDGAAFSGERGDPFGCAVLLLAAGEVELVAFGVGDGGFGGAQRFDVLVGVSAA